MVIQDVPQLAVFVRYVSADINIKKEMLDLVALNETTRGIDVQNALNEVINRIALLTTTTRDKLISVATDRALEMIGKYQARSHWSFKQRSQYSTILTSSLHNSPRASHSEILQV